LDFITVKSPINVKNVLILTVYNVQIKPVLSANLMIMQLMKGDFATTRLAVPNV
jgi:hypothetical protein